jgi:hypothetical protein
VLFLFLTQFKEDNMSGPGQGIGSYSSLLETDITGSVQFDLTQLMEAHEAVSAQMFAEAQMNAQRNAEVNQISRQHMLSLSEIFVQAQIQQLGDVDKGLRSLRGAQIEDPKILDAIHFFTQAQETYKRFLIDKQEHLRAEVESDRRYDELIKTFSDTSYGILTVQQQEEVDAKLQASSGGTITFAEIVQKFMYFTNVEAKIKNLSTELNLIAGGLKNKQQTLDASDFSKVVDKDLKAVATRLLAHRKRLDPVAESLNQTVPIDYKHLCQFIQRFIAVYGAAKLTKGDPSFIRGAGLSNQTVDEIYATYERMYGFICQLQGLADSFVTLWTNLSLDWDRVKDDLRKLSWIASREQVAVRTYRGERPWVGHDANGVKSFHFRPIESEMRSRGYIGGLVDWATGSSQPSSSST